MFYPQDVNNQSVLIKKKWHVAARGFNAFVQRLTLDLSENPNEMPKPIHAGFRSGREFLIDYLYAVQEIGVNSETPFLKYWSRPSREVIQELGGYVVPHFPALTSK